MGGRPKSIFRSLLESEASGGIVLMVAAMLGLAAANSPWSEHYFRLLTVDVFGLSLQHWVNDGLMAVFFLLVGLEIKRELLDGQLSTWSRRLLPGTAALGGMVAPALIYIAFNWSDAATLRGWAIPAATDIAFALGVLSLLRSRVPVSLKVFLTALAILDDLGAVLIIAAFYTAGLSFPALTAAIIGTGILVSLNRLGVMRLWPYILIGVALWFLVLRSGVHPTVAGVLLALTIPVQRSPGRPDEIKNSPLHRLEHLLHHWVAFVVVPIFGFANAGVSFAGLTVSALFDNLTLGIAMGLFLGKLIGVFGSAYLLFQLGVADVPLGAGKLQVLGVSLLCGIGFTMSLFIGLLAFAEVPLLQNQVKIGILAGSVLSGLLGWLVLLVAPRQVPAPKAS